MQIENNPTTNSAGVPPAPPEAHQRAIFTTTKQMITAKEIEGVTYYTTTRRGVEYTAYTARGQWIVLTHRLALGRRNPGGCKYFDSIQILCQSVKAFSGLDQLI